MVTSDRTTGTGNRHKLGHRKFDLNMRRNFKGGGALDRCFLLADLCIFTDVCPRKPM